MTTPALLSVEHLSKRYESVSQRIHALHDVSFHIEQGEFVCLLGPSGSGKSTILRIAAGLLPADGGVMRFKGTPITTPRREIGLVFQSANLMPWRTVLDNILLPVAVQSRIDDEAHRRAHALIELMGLAEFTHAWPRQLSGGMSQRVVLARTLMQQPELLLLDEPFGALDALTRERLNLELLRIQRLESTTALMVTHNIGEAVLLADRILVLSQRPGTIIASVPVPLARPRSIAQTGLPEFAALTLAVRNFIGDPAASPLENEPSA